MVKKNIYIYISYIITIDYVASFDIVDHDCCL